MTPMHSNISLIFILSLLFFTGCQQNNPANTTKISSQKFERIRYNNPDASVDLGVGLWAWPLPMDYDEDGDYDLLVSCKDVPFNGIYFFENTSGEAFPTFEPPVRIGDGLRDIQISYVNAEPRFLQPGRELLDFKTRLGSSININNQLKEDYTNLKKAFDQAVELGALEFYKLRLL